MKVTRRLASLALSTGWAGPRDGRSGRWLVFQHVCLQQHVLSAAVIAGDQQAESAIIICCSPRAGRGAGRKIGPGLALRAEAGKTTARCARGGEGRIQRRRDHSSHCVQRLAKPVARCARGGEGRIQRRSDSDHASSPRSRGRRGNTVVVAKRSGTRQEQDQAPAALATGTELTAEALCTSEAREEASSRSCRD